MSSKTCSETPSTRRRLEIPFINFQLSEKELCSKFGTHGWLCEENFSSPPSHKGAAVTRRTLTSPGEVEKVGKADHSQGNRGRFPGAASWCCAALRVPAPPPHGSQLPLPAPRRRSKHLGAPGVATATLLCVMRGMLCPANVSHRLASVCDGGDHDRQPAEALRLAGRRPCHQRTGLGEAVECAWCEHEYQTFTTRMRPRALQHPRGWRRWASDSRARNVRTLARRTHVESGSARTADAAAGIPLVRWRACQVPDLQVEYQKGSFACLYPCAC